MLKELQDRRLPSRMGFFILFVLAPPLNLFRLDIWQRGQADGNEIDLDAYLRFATERLSGVCSAEPGLYRDLRVGDRDLACLLLADLSLSTDAWINNEERIIDVIRDSLFLFSESLAATGDRFGLYGFSSRHRDHVRFLHIKTFEEKYDGRVRGRIAAIKPGFYTLASVVSRAVRFGPMYLLPRIDGDRGRVRCASDMDSLGWPKSKD